MNLLKKLTTLLLTTALVLGTSVIAFAAPNDDVITALNNAKVPATYVIQAENYLKTTTLTANEATSVVAQINDAAAIVEASGQTDITKLSADQKDQILANISAAGAAIGLDVSIDKLSNGQFSIIAKENDGTTVASFSSNAVKQTGMDTTLVYAGLLMIILAAGSVFVLRKYNLKATA